MAALAITVADQVWTPHRMTSFGSGNLGTYAAGGVAVTPGAFRLGVIDFLDIEPAADGTVFTYVPSTGKVMAFSGGAEVGAGDISASVFTYQAAGGF